MEKIIMDVYTKSGRTTNSKTIQALNDIYGWLYEKGILQKISFEFIEYGSEEKRAVDFAFNVKDIYPYRKDMEHSGVENVSTAIDAIFSEDCNICRWTGATTLSWPMRTYRNNNDCVSSSCECDICQDLSNQSVRDVEDVREKSGSREALKKAFQLAHGKVYTDIKQVV